METDFGALEMFGIFVIVVVWAAYEIGVIYIANNIMKSTPPGDDPLALAIAGFVFWSTFSGAGLFVAVLVSSPFFSERPIGRSQGVSVPTESYVPGGNLAVVGAFIGILVVVGVVTFILESNWSWFKRRAKQMVQQPKVAAKPMTWWDGFFAWWRTFNTPQQIGLVLFGVFVAWKIASAYS